MQADTPPEPPRVVSPRETADKKRSDCQKRSEKARDSEEAVDPQKAPVDSSKLDSPTEDPQKDRHDKARECDDDFTSTDEETLLKRWELYVFGCLLLMYRTLFSRFETHRIKSIYVW